MSKRPRLRPAIRMALSAYRKDNASRFGAALAFYIVFSIAPMLMIAIAVGGRFLGRRAAEQEILGHVGGSFGSAAAAAVAAMIRDAAAPRAGWFATGVGLMTLYFGLSGVYRQIDDAIRTIWHRGIEKKFTSILFVLATGVVMLVSVLADAAIAMTGKFASARLVGGEVLWHIAQLLVSTIVLSVLFALVFRYLTQTEVTWRDVRTGAVMTAVLFVIGKFALGLYLGKAAVGSAFGAAGSIVVILLWSYWSAQIFFFGLEFTHVYAQEREPLSPI